MLFTNEYTVLISQDGGKDVALKPGKTNAFNPIKGKFISTSYARILDTETLKDIARLEVGLVIDGVGQVIETKAKK